MNNHIESIKKNLNHINTKQHLLFDKNGTPLIGDYVISNLLEIIKEKKDLNSLYEIPVSFMYKYPSSNKERQITGSFIEESITNTKLRILSYDNVKIMSFPWFSFCKIDNSKETVCFKVNKTLTDLFDHPFLKELHLSGCASRVVGYKNAKATLLHSFLCQKFYCYFERQEERFPIGSCRNLIFPIDMLIFAFSETKKPSSEQVIKKSFKPALLDVVQSGYFSLLKERDGSIYKIQKINDEIQSISFSVALKNIV